MKKQIMHGIKYLNNGNYIEKSILFFYKIEYIKGLVKN